MLEALTAPLLPTAFRLSRKPATRIIVSSFSEKLDEADGNVSRAAELMGIDRRHLYRRMSALGINVRG